LSIIIDILIISPLLINRIRNIKQKKQDNKGIDEKA